jgi:ATP-dependent Clp protease ATP-binding subunit ClpA
VHLAITLFVRRHYGGQVLVRVAAEPSTCVFAEELDEALMDLTLLLTDRLERTHPRLLHQLASPDNAELVSLLLPEALPVHGELALERRFMRVSALVSRHKQYERLWFPSWDLRHWIAARSDVATQSIAFLREYLPRTSTNELLARRVELEEAVHTLVIDVSPPPLAAFTGRYLGASLLPEPVHREDDDEDEQAKPRAKSKRALTPTLDGLAIDLTERARRGELGRAVGLDAIADRLERELETAGGALVLVGPPGVGKTALVNELAHRLVARARKHVEQDRRVWFADAKRLLATRSMFTDWRSQTLNLIDEITTSGDVWYLGSVLPLLDAGKSIASDENIAQLLRPHLVRRRARIVGEATIEEWARLELRDPGLARAFTPVRLDEPDEAASLAILRGVAALRVGARPLVIDESAIRGARELGARFGGHASVHAASLALLSRTIEHALADEQPPARLDRNAVVDTFCRESGMPAVLIRDDLPLDPDAVREAFEARIVGQPEAVRRMVELVGVLKAGLSDPSRPLGSFLFVGPTGVGKTETAKALAEILYGSSMRLVRFDMSELATGDAVQRFVGLGGQPGKLVSEIRRSPFCVLLLDEIEKAHPVAFDALLQVLGEARLSDEAGRTASFRNVVVVMTSNLGAETLRASVGFGQGGTASWAEHFTSEARKFFRPELFNRIDHVVPFAALAPSAIEGIADRELARVAKREGLHHRGLRLEVPPEVRAHLVARGIDPRYGARPLKRAIEQHLAAPLARRLSAMRAVEPGAVTAHVSEGALDFAYERARAGDAQSEEALRRALLAVSELRYFVDRCGLSPVIRELRLEASRIERLLASPRYLRGYESWRDRLAEAGSDGELLASYEGMRAHAESLEDLAHEATAARDPSAVPSLRSEHTAVVQRIKELGLGLAARGLARPDRAVLLLSMRSNAQVLCRMLFRIYVGLAQERGWTLTPYVVEEREADAEPRRDARGTEVASTVKVFVEQGARDPRHLVDHLLGLVGESKTVLALRFDGPHCAALLAGESGAHESHDAGETLRASIRVEEKHELLEREHDPAAWDALLASFPSTVIRTHHHGKNLVEDRTLDVRVPMEPRLERVYERFMLARLYDAVFYRGAHRALARGLAGG